MIFPVEVKDFRKYGRDRNLRVTGLREKSCRDGGFEEPLHCHILQGEHIRC